MSINEENITNKTVAILAPNLIGNVCNWPVKDIAIKYDLKVIEDSADTLERLLMVSARAYSDMSITSFYGSHVVHCAGNGGALSLNDENVINQAKIMIMGRSSSLDEKDQLKIGLILILKVLNMMQNLCLKNWL